MPVSSVQKRLTSGQGFRSFSDTKQPKSVEFLVYAGSFYCQPISNSLSIVSH